MNGLLQPTHVLLLGMMFGLLCVGCCAIVGVPWVAYRTGYNRGYRDAVERSQRPS